MPDVKISALPAATTPLAGTEVLPIVQSSTTKKVSVADLTAGRAISASSITNSALTSGRVTYAGASGLLSDSSKLTFDTSNLTVGVTGLSANADGATGKLVLRKPNEALGTGQITRMLDFAPYYPGYDEAVVKASIFSGVDTGTQNGQIGFMTATGGVLYEKMRLLANGNLGIGTSSPTALLTLGGVAATGYTSLLANGTTTAYNLWTLNNTGGDLRIGIESATAVGLLTGSSNYSACIGTLTANNLHLGTNSTVRATIDSSGNLGLGVTPSAWETTSGSRAIQFTGSSVYGYRDTNLILTQNAYFDGAFKYYASSIASAYYGIGSGVHAWYTAASGTAGNAITFTQAMTLDASGNLLIGDTSQLFSGKLGIKFNGNGTNGISLQTTFAGPGDAYLNFVDQAGTQIGYIYRPTTTTVAFVSTSDQRLKTNIVDAASGLAKLANVKIRSFNWDKDGSFVDFGIIAQELNEIAPECVRIGSDDLTEDGNLKNPWSAQPYILVPAMIKAIQEQQALIESLTTRLTALENK